MVKYLIYRPISVIVLVIGLLCLSIFVYSKIEVALLPNIGIPNMSILVDAPNYSPVEVEQKMLRPIRRYLNTIDGVSEMSSSALWGSGKINITFRYGVEMNKAFIETNEVLDLSMDDLPDDISRPRAVKTRVEDLPAYYLSLKYVGDAVEGNFLQLSEYVKEVFTRRLEQLPEVALVDVHGTRNMQIALIPNESFLSALGVGHKELQDALIAHQIGLTSIMIKERAYQYLVRLGKPLTSIADIQRTPIRVGNRVLKIGDLAKVEIEEARSPGIYRFNGEEAISLAVIKSPQASLDLLEDSLNQICEEVRKERPDIAVFVSRDQTRLLRVTIDNLKTSLLLGSLLAIGIVFFFYSEWRIPVIIGIVIPTSLLLTLLTLYAFGRSLNMISISGLLLGLGLMIDNGIIVLDNISQELRSQESLSKACIRGTNEMIRPLLTSMLTTCGVFLPLVMISGIAGALFGDQVLTVSISLIISYLISITLLPTLYFLMLKRKKVASAGKSNWIAKTLSRIYKYGLVQTLEYSGVVFVLLFLLVTSGYMVLKHLPVNRFPALPEEAMEVNIDWNAAILPEVSASRVTEIFKDLEISWQAHIGVSQYLLGALYDGDTNSASIYVKIPEDIDASQLKSEIQQNVNTLYPSAIVSFSAEKTAFELLFPQESIALTARCFVNTQDNARSSDVFHQINNAVEDLPLVKGITLSDSERAFIVEPDLQNAIRYSVEQEELLSALRKTLGDQQITELSSFQYKIPVVIKNNVGTIENLGRNEYVTNREGRLIPLDELITVRSVRQERKILASAEGTYRPIGIDTKYPEKVEQQIAKIDQQNPMISIDLVGAYQQNRELVNEVTKAMLISILLLYVLLAAQFESFLQPIIVLIEIPISLCGSIFLLWLCSGSINIMSLIGMVVTIGIIINDSIIKVDTINHLRKKGASVKEAVHKGGVKRLNPIIMTSLTTIFAVIPFLYGSDLGSMLQRPLALSLIGGMIVGTLVSLYVIPLLYYNCYKTRKV